MPRTPQAGFDYAPLRDALAAGDFQKADDITRAALIQLAGPGAVKRNWVYFTGGLPLTAYITSIINASDGLAVRRLLGVEHVPLITSHAGLTMWSAATYWSHSYRHQCLALAYC